MKDMKQLLDEDDSCALNHEHHHHEEECDCGHEHHHHDEECDCGHDHHHHEEECGCGHEHHHHEEECDCGHEHHRHEEECDCGHDHHHHGHHHHDHDSCGCGCGHDHGHIEEDILKRQIISFVSSAVLFVIALVIEHFYPSFGSIAFGFFVVSYVIVGFPVLRAAARNIAKGRVFDENFLMAVATLGAFALRQYPEAVAVMLFYNIGETLSDVAIGKSRKSIESLMDLNPEKATVITPDGKETVVDPDAVKIGDFILVRPGERIPLDGELVQGEGFVDNSALTGESEPISVQTGDEILSGGVCGNGLLLIRVNREFENSAVSRIMKMTEESADKKAKTERFLTRFAAKYTPCVVIGALLVALVPPTFHFGTYSEWIHKALTMLVVSCPCALVLSVPLTYFGGIGRASKSGILVKGGDALEALAHVQNVVFDKTGTLTDGKLRVSKVLPADGLDEDICLGMAAAGEQYSNHPAAQAIVNAYNGEKIEVSDFQELPGKGIRCRLKDKTLYIGNMKLMQAQGIRGVFEQQGTAIYLAYDEVYAGAILLEDEVRAEAKDAIKKLRSLGVEKTIMLTGDTQTSANRVAASVGIDTVYASLMPEDKVAKLDMTLRAPQTHGSTVYVGDGINDAPVLKLADVGVAMGGAGTDAAVEAADVVIMTDHLQRLPEALRISRFTRTLVRQNVAMTLGVKILVLLLTLVGLSNMWEAVFADVGMCVLSVFNATRVLRQK